QVRTRKAIHLFRCLIHSNPICIYFVPSAGALRPLRSFPTRRSSDLGGGQQRRPYPHHRRWRRRGGRRRGAMLAHRRQLRRARVRSEEHTSELQSLRHLVCRLLLEKKKLVPPPEPIPAVRKTDENLDA